MYFSMCYILRETIMWKVYRPRIEGTSSTTTLPRPSIIRQAPPREFSTATTAPSKRSRHARRHYERGRRFLLSRENGSARDATYLRRALATTTMTMYSIVDMVQLCYMIRARSGARLYTPARGLTPSCRPHPYGLFPWLPRTRRKARSKGRSQKRGNVRLMLGGE